MNPHKTFLVSLCSADHHGYGMSVAVEVGDDGTAEDAEDLAVALYMDLLAELETEEFEEEFGSGELVASAEVLAIHNLYDVAEEGLGDAIRRWDSAQWETFCFDNTAAYINARHD